MQLGYLVVSVRLNILVNTHVAATNPNHQVAVDDLGGDFSGADLVLAGAQLLDLKWRLVSLHGSLKHCVNRVSFGWQKALGG